jgi:spermidine/putrescine-binding protein
MKKILFCIAAALLITALFSAGSVFAEKEEVKDEELNIWTWGIYCPDFATESFEEKYGIKVNCTFYHGNEELWSKLQAGHAGVDIVQPSNHMIQRFAKAGLLSPIDISRIPNYAGLSEGFKKADYNTVDGKQYSVPYTYGIMGVAYRTDLVADPPTSWGALWNEKYKGKIAFSRNPVDACFGVALYLGMDIAKLDEDIDAKLVKIKAKMREQNPLLLKRIESLEEMKNLLASGEVWLTSADDGMIHKMQLDGQPVGFVVPKEGSAAWIDQFCVMSDAPHKDAAYLWIDHMLSPEIASQMIKKMGYMVVNAEAASNLPPEMAEIMTYTDEETKRLSPYPTLKPETNEKMVKAYQDVRGQ